MLNTPNFVIDIELSLTPSEFNKFKELSDLTKESIPYLIRHTMNVGYDVVLQQHREEHNDTTSDGSTSVEETEVTPEGADVTDTTSQHGTVQKN
jgi:hypothetical protein